MFIVSSLSFRVLRQCAYYFVLTVTFFSSCKSCNPSSSYKYNKWKDPAEIPSKKPTKKLFVYLHGTGGNGNEIESLHNFMQQHFPNCHLMAPHGTEPADEALYHAMDWNYKLNENNRQFVSLRSIAPLMKEIKNYQTLSPERLEALYKENKSTLDRMRKELEQAGSRLMEMIKKKQKQLNLTNKDTIIAGFSQGAMLGLYLTLTQEEPFLGMISFAGFLVEPKTYKYTDTPILFVHGTDDSIIPVGTVDIASKQLKQKGIYPDTEIIPRGKHGVVMDKAMDWIKQNCIARHTSIRGRA